MAGKAGNTKTKTTTKKRPKERNGRALAQEPVTPLNDYQTIQAAIADEPRTRMGRPEIPVLLNDGSGEKDWADFEKLCGIQCTELELASWFGVSVDTLSRRVEERYGKTFADVFAEKRSIGQASLRRAQYANAMAGHPTLQVWLGKQMLGQKDVHQVEGGKTPIQHQHSGGLQVKHTMRVVAVEIPANGWEPGGPNHKDDHDADAEDLPGDAGNPGRRARARAAREGKG